MNFLCAMKCMIDGEKIRYTGWDNGTYIYMDKCTGDILDERGEYYAIRSIDNEDEEWEIYKEKEEKYMISDGMGDFIFIYELEDDKDFIAIEVEEENDNGGYNKISMDLHKDDIKDLIKELINLL